MVGVPRSKGCANCRRRKVACDQTKPQCLVCQKRGVPCEGYAKYPVILQWTNTGLKKRERFDEIAPKPPPGPIAVLSVRSSDSKSPSAYSSSPSSWSSIEDDFNIIPTRQPHSACFVLEQMEVRCLETYLPNTGAAVSDVKSSWMWQIVDLPARGNVLNCAFAALSLARMGAVRRDQDLVLQGRKQYAMALTQLQTALYDSELAFQDRTLAAMRTLSIYELLSPTLSSTAPEKTHEEGMIQWCRAAGPRRIRSEFALLVFHDVRWSIMIHGIDRSKSSVLGNEEWLTLPWLPFHKDRLQQLFDNGFSIAAILEQINNFDNNVGQEVATQLSMLCFGVQQNLDLWYSKHWGTLEHSTVLLLGGLFEASNMVYYWWFRMELNQALMKLSSHLYMDTINAYEGSLEQLATTSLQSENTRLAGNIVQTAPLFSAEDTGWLGPQRLLFPLKRAMVHLSSVKSPVFAEAQAVFMQLIKKMRTC